MFETGTLFVLGVVVIAAVVVVLVCLFFLAVFLASTWCSRCSCSSRH